MELLTVEQILERFKGRSIRYISRQTGISEVSLHRLKHGQVDNPKYETIKTLSEFFDRNK